MDCDGRTYADGAIQCEDHADGHQREWSENLRGTQCAADEAILQQHATAHGRQGGVIAFFPTGEELVAVSAHFDGGYRGDRVVLDGLALAEMCDLGIHGLG